MSRMLLKNKTIARSFIDGKSTKQCCTDSGLSKQRVHQIVRAYCKPFLFYSEKIKAEKENWGTRKIAEKVNSLDI